jgi:hypothetical protein
MRPGLLLLLLAAACGRDGTSLDPSPDGGAIVAPDGKIITPGDAVDAPITEPDAIVELTECQQATQHSDLAWIQQKVFTPSCATAMCHGGADPEVGLNLEAGRSYANLVNRNTSTVAGWVRVVPGALATSYLVVAFGRTEGPPPRDGFMPLGAEALCVEKHEAVERWILAGAPNN